MAREILFKAKRTDNGEWVEGYLVKCRTSEEDGYAIKDTVYHVNDGIINLIPCMIDENTLCQYTGLTDKNGNKIWENDVVTGVSFSAERIGIIVWIHEIAGFGVRYKERDKNDPTAWENATILKNIIHGKTDIFTAKVIGNVFDNPELIKAGGVNG